LHNSGRFYTVIPHELVWNNDFYYLVCYDESKENIVNYRVDRMVNVRIEEQEFIKKAFNITEHLKHCFNMYPGEVDVVEIQFKNKLINAVIDKFGTNLTLLKVDKVDQ